MEPESESSLMAGILMTKTPLKVQNSVLLAETSTLATIFKCHIKMVRVIMDGIDMVGGLTFKGFAVLSEVSITIMTTPGIIMKARKLTGSTRSLPTLYITNLTAPSHSLLQVVIFSSARV